MSETRVGLSKTMNNGQLFTITYYINSKNMGGVFEDGTEVNNRKFNDFTRGAIKNPNLCNSLKNIRIGEKRVMPNGKLCTIIDYRNKNDITVQFEDGTIVEHVRYNNFKNGYIKNPNSLHSLVKNRIGERLMMKNGMPCEIVDQRNAHDLDVRWDDGTTIKNTSYRRFYDRTLTHPILKSGGVIGNMNVTKLILKVNDNGGAYYDCTCSKCGKNDLLTPTQMLIHTC